MRYFRMKIKHIAACVIALVVALERLPSYQNGGFRASKLVSSLPPILSTPPEEVDALLDQPFRYFGKGGTCLVFLGADGKTVLKLFKHQHLYSRSFLFHIALPGIADFWRVQKIAATQKKHAHKWCDFFLGSCALAYASLKEETGLIY